MTSSSSVNSQQQGILFGYHIYDLSAGIATRFAPSLIGETLPNGVLHAAVVIFGHEYFFEGGISKRPAGCTRFGKNFSFVPAPLPATAIISSESEFDVWVRAVECTRFSIGGYSILENNCHHFCEAATLFLTQGKTTAPDIIRKNISPLLKSEMGLLCLDFIAFSQMCAFAQGEETRLLRRKSRMNSFEIQQLMHRSSSLTTTNQQEQQQQRRTTQNVVPLQVFTYNTSSNNNNQHSFQEILTAIQEMISFTFDNNNNSREEKERQMSKERLEELFFSDPLTSNSPISSNNNTNSCNSNNLMKKAMTATEASTLATSLAQILQSESHTNSFQQLQLYITIFTQLSLHENFVLEAVHDHVLDSFIMRLCKRFFVVLPKSLKIRTLELMCNVFHHSVGAACFSRSPKYAGAIVLAICRGMLDPNSWSVLHRASCFAVSFMNATTLLARPPFDREVLARGNSHIACRIAVVCSFICLNVIPTNLQIKEKLSFSTSSSSDSSSSSFSSPYNCFLATNKKRHSSWDFHNSTEDDNNKNNSNTQHNFMNVHDATRLANEVLREILGDDSVTDFLGKKTNNNNNAPDCELSSISSSSSSSSSDEEDEDEEEPTAPLKPNFSRDNKGNNDDDEFLVDKNNFIDVTQNILSNCLRTLIIFAVAGRVTNGMLTRHPFTPSFAEIRSRCSNEETLKLAYELSLLI